MSHSRREQSVPPAPRASDMMGSQLSARSSRRGESVRPSGREFPDAGLISSHAPSENGYLTTPRYAASEGAVSTDIAAQHNGWSSELESVDQKQADLVVLQWKLVRNQTGMLAQQLVEARKVMDETQRELKELSLSSMRTDQYVRESDAFEQRIKTFVRGLFEKVEASMTQMRDDLAQEVHSRQAGETLVQRKLETLGEELVRVGKEILPMPQDLLKLQAEIATHYSQIVDVQEKQRQTADEVRGIWDQVVDNARIMKDDIAKEKRERQQVLDGHVATMRGLVDKEKAERDLKIQAHINPLYADVQAHKEEMPVFRGRFQSIDDRVSAVHQELMQAMESRFGEPASKLHQQTERRLEHMQASISQESVARSSLAEVFEEMLKNERTKLTNLVAQKSELARLDGEDMKKALHERMDMERGDRELHIDRVSATDNMHSTLLNDRLNSFEIEVQGLDAKNQAFASELRGADERHHRLEEVCLAAVREARREAHAAVTEEGSAREAADASLKEEIDWLGEHHDTVRDIFFKRGPRSKPAA